MMRRPSARCGIVCFIFLVGSFASGCGRLAVSTPAQSVTVAAINGVPVRVPPLQTQNTHDALALIAWKWDGRHGLNQHTMHTGPVPWKRVSLATQRPLVLQWHTAASPNTVNVTVFRHLPVPGQMVVPHDVVQSCMVNATYPQSRGCTLGAHDTLRIVLTPGTQRKAVGMLISAMWLPNHIGNTTTHILDHQAAWVTALN